MIKVLYLLNHAGKAGTERYVYTLIEKLNNKRIKAYFAYNEEGLLVERLKNIGVETFVIEMKNPFDVKAAFELSRLCKKLGIDLIHTQFLRENYIAILSKIFNPRIKVIYTNHFVMANNRIQKFFNRLMTQFNSGIIAVCNVGRDMLISNGNKASIIEVIFNGVDVAYWKEPVESTLRKELKIGGDEFVILCASRFAHDKGHKYLVDSIKLLKDMTNRKFKCVLAGDGPLLDDIKKQVAELGLQDDIIFIGFRSDMKNLYTGSDLYVNSSEHEALSFLIIEALASGLPVVATNMGGNSDIINPITNCGLLVEYNNPESMAKGILKLMEDENLYRKFKENAYKAVDEFFNLDKVVDKTYNLYEKSLQV
ncbi:MAG TPA: glycosyltransferase [Clostridiaceae bacterium]|nr:glycosyltransferase [Clostridiaceae bacterium]